MKKTLLALGVILLLIVAAGLVVVWVFRDKDSGPAMDEAMAAGKKPSDFPAAANDFFHDMDGGVAMNEAQVKGRNTWIVWTAGNEAFWDYLANHSSARSIW